MLTIAWNQNGIRLIHAFPEGEQYSARYDIDNSRTPICQRSIPAGKRKSVIHVADFRCHTAKVVLNFVSQRKVRFAPRPPYSRAVTLSALFRFGYLKRELGASRFQTAEELLPEVQKLVGEISPETLMGLFHDWIARRESVTGNDGNCFE
jgi:hypothetical protein